jgi:2-polyprenyl-3-methyl-5-hydroxy-6-metoxy-1,4-benzoquinol methylase
MDKLNQELIEAKKRLVAIEEEKKALDEEYKFLQDKIHLYFDSDEYDTDETQKYIIGDFWSKAYKNYKDGGYITNDEYMSKVRFEYEVKELETIINENIKNKSRALDIGCGNGRYTKEFAKLFDNTVGIDLSQERIIQNNQENQNPNINYIYENFMTMQKDALGKFDFVFVGDIFMYTPANDVENVYNNLLKLLNKDGFLVIRESTLIHGNNDWKSKGYVAYYRNVDFYKSGIFEKTFVNLYRNYGYSLYYLDKYFNIFKDAKKDVENNPFLLKEIVPKFVDKSLKSSHFYLHKV